MTRFLTALVLACLLAPVGAAMQAAAEEAPVGGRTVHPLRAECGLNLLALAGDLYQYYQTHDSRLPGKLSDLYGESDTTKHRNLICPGMQPSVVEGGFYPSYAYVRVTPDDRTLDPETQDLIAFDAGPVHEDGRNVLLTSLEAVYLEEDAFQRMLAEQQERWASEGRTVEIITDDLFPLREEAKQDLFPTRPAFVSSWHFKAVVALVLAIGVLAVLLHLQAKKKSPANN